MLAVPVLLQKDSHSCGVVAADMIVRYFNRRFDSSLRSNASPFDGTDPRTLEHLLRRHGLKVMAGEGSLSELKYTLRRFRPVACLVTLNGIGHWVVVFGTSRSRIHLNCPIEGQTSLETQEFLKKWIDHDGKGGHWERWMVTAFE